MATPLDAVTAIHNAFRRDIAIIDSAGRSVRGSRATHPEVGRR